MTKGRRLRDSDVGRHLRPEEVVAKARVSVKVLLRNRRLLLRCRSHHRVLAPNCRAQTRMVGWAGEMGWPALKENAIGAAAALPPFLEHVQVGKQQKREEWRSLAQHSSESAVLQLYRAKPRR